MGFMSPKKPKLPPPPAPPKPIAPKAELVTSDSDGRSSFEEELRKRQKRTQTVMAGETGGYGGNTKLG